VAELRVPDGLSGFGPLDLEELSGRYDFHAESESWLEDFAPDEVAV
jgi:hypothetical protein